MKKFVLLIVTLFVLFGFCSCKKLNQMNAKERRYFDAISAVYNLTIFPVNDYVIETGILPDVFNPNVQARVYDFALHHTGPLDVAEYFYGLTPNSHTYETLSSIVIRVDFNRFIVDDNVVFTSINYVTRNLHTNAVTNGTQLGQWRFDENDKIKEIDNTQLYFDIAMREAIPDSIYPFYVEGLIAQTCTRHQSNCLGANQQYANYDACVAFIRTLPFGTPDLNEWNSGVCRWWHSFLTYLRPEVHCSHVGPTGGGKCVNFSQASLYNPFFDDEDRLIGPSRFFASVTYPPQN
jgi:hypothetical protein